MQQRTVVEAIVEEATVSLVVFLHVIVYSGDVAIVEVTQVKHMTLNTRFDSKRTNDLQLRTNVLLARKG